MLPLRFGTVVPDEAAARRLLDEHARLGAPAAAADRDAREWGVKLVRRLDQPVPVGPRPQDRVGVTGTEYLTRRRQALDQYDSAEAAAEEAAQLLIDALRPHVTESVRRGGSPGSSLLLDLAVLVGADAEAAFLATAAELRQRLEPDGLEVEVSGPWPPYSFASAGGRRWRERPGILGGTSDGTSLVELLDRVVHRGAYVSGDVTICLAGIDLVRLDLRLLLTAVADAEPVRR